MLEAENAAGAQPEEGLQDAAGPAGLGFRCMLTTRNLGVPSWTAGSEYRGHHAACRDADGDADNASADSEEAEDDADEEEDATEADERLSRAALALSADAAAIARVRPAVAASLHHLHCTSQTFCQGCCCTNSSCHCHPFFCATTAQAAEAGPQTATVHFAGWEQHTRGVASKLMAAMGFVHGQGLGSARQGSLAPPKVDALRVFLPRPWLKDAWLHVQEFDCGCCRRACCRGAPAWAIASRPQRQRSSPRSGAAEARRSAHSDHVVAFSPSCEVDPRGMRGHAECFSGMPRQRLHTAGMVAVVSMPCVFLDAGARRMLPGQRARRAGTHRTAQRLTPARLGCSPSSTRAWATPSLARRSPPLQALPGAAVLLSWGRYYMLG